MRLKILALSSLISFAVASYGLYSILPHVDFFATKNNYLHNKKRIELLKQKNVDSLRATALKILDANQTLRKTESEHGKSGVIDHLHPEQIDHQELMSKKCCQI